MHLEPGGHDLIVPPGENVLAAALAAGIALPHSCRAGRCASCKAKLLEGTIRYPDDRLPPGIVASEAAKGEVLLCQATPASDLRIETRRASAGPIAFAESEVVAIDALPFDARRLRATLVSGTMPAKPGQFVDARNDRGDAARLAVVGVTPGELALEASAGDGPLREWLDEPLARGARLRLTGPFDRPR